MKKVVGTVVESLWKMVMIGGLSFWAYYLTKSLYNDLTDDD